MNYEKIMNEQINDDSYGKTLLLHACCAPCSTTVLDIVANHFKVTIFYYNPNITDKEEYDIRLNELEKILKKSNYKFKVNLIKANYNSNEFYNEVKGYETHNEGGKRCYLCYKLRLENTVKYAKDNNYDYFSTVLSISPRKNSKWINEIGEILNNEYNVKFLYADFKKSNGYINSIAKSRELNLYRQTYCGCEFSKRT